MATTELGPYLLLDALGSGGMGMVYRARVVEPSGDLRVGEHVAIKIIHPKLLERRGSFQQFLREGELGSRISHPNVVRTHSVDMGRFKGERVCFLVMELVSGRNMRRMLGEIGAFPESLVREVALQVANGLVAIHACGVVHRDLKPENILITDDEQVRILDLGVARAVDATVDLTRTGEFKGTLCYASPEQLGDGEIHFACDQYSLGVVLYELIAGVKPFRQDSAQRLMVAHLCEPPRLLSEQCPTVSRFLCEVVHTLLQKDPSHRFPSTPDLRQVLAEGEKSAWWSEREWRQRNQTRLVPSIPVRRDQVFQGREVELSRLRSLWTKGISGRGSTLLIEGESGIGKSRLIDAFFQAAATGDVHVLYGSYTPASAPRALSDAVVNLFGNAGLGSALSTYLSHLSPLAPALTALLKQESPPAGAAPVTRDMLQMCFTALLQGLAKEKPVLWVIEDLHFATEDSRNVVMALMRAVVGHRGLLVVSTRPGGFTHRELAMIRRLDGFHRMTLERLEEQDVHALLLDALQNPILADRLGARIAARSDGIPLFVCEMVRSLKDDRLVQTQSGRWTARGNVEEIEVPPAVKELIDARLEDLSPDQRDALDVGAVIGFEFDPRMVAAVLSRPAVSVLRDLAHLERETDLVISKGAACRFDHHQIREHLYQVLPGWLRSEYHHLVATVRRKDLEKADPPGGAPAGETAWFLAYHFLNGSHPEQGLTYLETALQHLARGYRDEEVRDLIQLALKTAALPPRERIELLLSLSRHFMLSGRHDENERTIESARELGEQEQDPVLTARILCARGHHLILTCRFLDAEETLVAAADVADTTDCLSLRAHIHGCLGSVALNLSRFDHALERYEAHLALAVDADDPVEQFHAHSELAVLLSILGEPEQVALHLVSRGRLAREIGDPRALEGGTMTTSAALSTVDTSGSVLTHLEGAWAASKAAGDLRGAGISLTLLGALAKNVGRHDEAITRLEQARKILSDLGARNLEGNAVQVLGEVREQMGELKPAEDLFSLVLSVREELSDLAGVSDTCQALGRVNLRSGRPNAAVAWFRRALTISGETGQPRTRLLARCYLCLLGEEIVEDVAGELERIGPRLCRAAQLEANHVLFQVTGSQEHRARAADLLDELLAIAPEEDRAQMIRSIPVYAELRGSPPPDDR